MLRIPPQNLRTPGPTPIPDDIVDAMTNPMINHRGPEFDELITKTTEQLQQVFMTSNDVLILTASGTGALEAALVNTLSPGDRVLSATAGSFGDRFTDMADAFGADVKRLEFEWGAPVEPAAIREALQADPEIKAVMVTHNETSTGINPSGGGDRPGGQAGVRQAVLGGRCQQSGLHPPAGRRLGLRPGRHRLPEGFHDPPRPRVYKHQ